MVGMSLKSVYSLPVKIILGRKIDDLSDALYKRLRFLCVIYAVGFAFTLLLLSIDTAKRFPVGMLLDFTILAGIVVICIKLRSAKTYRWAFHATVAVLAAVIQFTYFLAIGTPQALLLMPMVLILAYFLLGQRSGLLWSIAVICGNIAALAIGQLGWAYLPITTHVMVYSIMNLAVISAFLYVYEGVNKDNEERIAVRDRKLKTLNGQLADEKAHVEHLVEVRTHQLHEEEARLQASIMALELGFIMVLRDWSVARYNPALLHIVDGLVENSNVSLVWQLIEKVHRSYHLDKAIEKCLKNGKSFSKTDIPVGDKFVRIIGSAIHNGHSGKVIGVVLLVEDMTEEKMLERREDEFVSIASHELRTPLTVIEGNLSIIEDEFGSEIKDEALKHMLGNVKDSSGRLIQIVNQFLNMTRLEQNKTVFNLTRADINSIVRQVASELGPIAHKKGLEVKMELATENVCVTADVRRLQEIVSNMFDNAIKYTDKGSIILRTVHTGNDVIFQVEDTGKGIEPKNQKHLFYKFHQATNNILTRDDSRSTGLGLYISRLLAEQMGGRVELTRSVPGKGSLFTLTLRKYEK